MLQDGGPSTFRETFGLNEHVYRRLLTELLQRSALEDGKHITADEQLAIFLYICATGSSARKAAENFQRNSNTISKYFHRVADALSSDEMVHTFIRLQKAPDATLPDPEILDSSMSFPYFKDCLGALGSTYIDGNVPIIDRGRGPNRKDPISQIVLAAVSFDMRFVSMLNGLEGRTSASRLLEDARSLGFEIPEGKFFLGDTGFPGSQSVLVPYRGRYRPYAYERPCDMRELFNLRHAQAREIVERTFDVFKLRFQIFSKPLEWSVETQLRLGDALAVVHNIIRLYDPDDDLSDEEFEEDFEEEGFNNEAAENIGRLGNEPSTAEEGEAELIRDRIASELWDSFGLYRI